MAAFFDNWTIQVRKGVLELCILNALQEDECYGYALVKQLVAIPGLHVAEGTIYPLLSRLKQQNLVATRLEESPDGPARKYYKLTNEGRLARARMNTYYRELSLALEGLASPI
ncbi:MAG: PadR family transcriptional regulator [Verrucomicrobiales bacterium]